jgi:hypothetical protein
LFADSILRFMDRIGNRRYSVALPFNYWREEKWRCAFAELGLMPKFWESRLGLYPWPASVIFERNLHFVTLLEKLLPGGA